MMGDLWDFFPLCVNTQYNIIGSIAYRYCMQLKYLQLSRYVLIDTLDESEIVAI